MTENAKKTKLVNIVAAFLEISILLPLSYPLDSLKSRMQTGYYKSYDDFFKSLKSFDHNKSLYRGSGILYAGLSIRQPMKMVTFESFSDPFYGSIFTTCVGLILGIPISFIKTNYQTNNNFKLSWNLIKTTNMGKAWKYEIAKECAGNVAFFTLYGSLRKYNTLYGKKYEDFMNFINGTISSTVATSIAYPIDIIKVRKQTIQRNNTFKEIFTSIGYVNDRFMISNFWKGSVPIYIRVSVFGGIGMFVYEKAKQILTPIFK